MYRAANAGAVRRLVETALAKGWQSAWWALDRVDDRLAEQTVGCGPGLRLSLLNEVVARAAPPRGWLVVCDDDVVFTRGKLDDVVLLARRAGLDLAQPAHSAGSACSHPITGSRVLSIARATNFVEIGPVFAVGPEWRERVLPFPDDRGMGWGLELEWRRLHEEGCSLGILDCVTVKHTGTVGSEYDAAGHKRRMKEELAGIGASSWEELNETLMTWRPWQATPPWCLG